MERTKPTKKNRSPADAILVSDLHLTDSTPVSRTDDYIAAQIRKLQFLQSLSDKNNNCPVICAGDVFDHWKASPWLCAMGFYYLPRPFIGIPGQHDLPEHSLKEFPRSALSLLEEVSDLGDFIILNEVPAAFPNELFIVGLPFGTLMTFELDKLKPLPACRKVLVLHELTWQGKRPSWDKGSQTDLELLDRFGADFDLILTGDNHKGFITKKGNSLLVNPGSMMRSTADQEDYKPRCYLYYADDNDVEPAYFPIEKGVINREHIDMKKERENRTTAYIANIRQWKSGGLSFKKNLEAFFKENQVTLKVKEIIWSHLEDDTSEKRKGAVHQ